MVQYLQDSLYASWLMYIAGCMGAQVDTMVVNRIKPDHTAVKSTLWEIQLLPDGDFANETLFLKEETNVLKCFLAYHTIRLHIFKTHRKTVFQTLFQSLGFLPACDSHSRKPPSY